MPIVHIAKGVWLEVMGRNVLGYQYLDITWQHDMVQVEAADSGCLFRGDRFNLVYERHRHQPYVCEKAAMTPSQK